MRQCISQALYGISAVFLAAYSALAQSIVSIGRNLYGACGKGKKAIEYSFVVLAVAMGLAFNNRGRLWLD